MSRTVHNLLDRIFDRHSFSRLVRHRLHPIAKRRWPPSGGAVNSLERDPVGENDPLRRGVVRARMLTQRSPRLSHDRALPECVAYPRPRSMERRGANVAATVGGSARSRDEAKTALAELAITHPQPISRLTRNSAATEHEGLTGSLARNQAGEKGIGIRGNPCSSSCAAQGEVAPSRGALRRTCSGRHRAVGTRALAADEIA